MSNMIVRVEFLAGTSIRDAVEESINKAVLWQVSHVKFKFNGIELSVHRSAYAQDVIDEYNNKIMIAQNINKKTL